MAYTPTHPGGWKDRPDETTPITAASLDAIEAGIVAASAAVDQRAAYVKATTGSEARPDAGLVIWVCAEGVTPANAEEDDLVFSPGGSAPSGTPPTITTTSLNSMTEGSAFSQTLVATGDAPVSWAVTTGSTPAGLSLSAGGALTGTPTAAGSYSFTVTATNDAGSDTQAYSGTVAAAGSGIEHTVFGASTSLADGPITLYNDGTYQMWTANQFYTYGSPAYEGWEVVGVRIYVPAGASGEFLATAGRVAVARRAMAGQLWEYTHPASDGKAALNANVSGGDYVAGFSSLVVGWNDIYLNTPLPLPHLTGVLAGVQWLSGGYYLHSTMADGGATTSLESGVRLARSEWSVSGSGEGVRGYNDANGTAGEWGPAIYGLDIIMREPS